jgi:hypothetical protein
MSRSKQRNQPSTRTRSPAAPRTADRLVKAQPRPATTELAQTELATHLDLVATIGLLHSLFSSQSSAD